MKKVFLLGTALCMVLVMGCSADHSGEGAADSLDTGETLDAEKTIEVEAAPDSVEAVSASSYNSSDKTVDEIEAEIIAQEEERKAYLEEYIGSYSDGNNEFEIYKEDDNYYMDVTITRLRSFTKCDIEPCNGGIKITNSDGAGDGNLITFEFTKKGEKYTLLVTDSSWGYLPAGEKFRNIKKVDSES